MSPQQSRRRWLPHVEEQAHPTEVDLQFGAWLPVRHPDRVLLAAKAHLLDTEAVQGPR